MINKKVKKTKTQIITPIEDNEELIISTPTPVKKTISKKKIIKPSLAVEEENDIEFNDDINDNDDDDIGINDNEFDDDNDDIELDNDDDIESESDDEDDESDTEIDDDDDIEFNEENDEEDTDIELDDNIESESDDEDDESDIDTEISDEVNDDEINNDDIDSEDDEIDVEYENPFMDLINDKTIDDVSFKKYKRLFKEYKDITSSKSADKETFLKHFVNELDKVGFEDIFFDMTENQKILLAGIINDCFEKAVLNTLFKDNKSVPFLSSKIVSKKIDNTIRKAVPNTNINKSTFTKEFFSISIDEIVRYSKDIGLLYTKAKSSSFENVSSIKEISEGKFLVLDNNTFYKEGDIIDAEGNKINSKKPSTKQTSKETTAKKKKPTFARRKTKN